MKNDLRNVGWIIGKKVFDDGEGMIRQEDRAKANYRKSETLPGLILED